MTKEEKLIVSAYTGVLMVDFDELRKYVEKLLGRPLWTHEFALGVVANEIKEKSRADFMKLCDDLETKKIYYIENLVSEWCSRIVGYYSTLENAKEALKDCADWYRPNGTGKIYEVELDSNELYPKLVYERR